MKQFLILIYILSIAFTATTEVPVFYSKLDGNLNNEARENSEGTAFGPVLTSDRFGEENKAYQFDGVDDYLAWDYYEEMDIGTTDFTISFWFKPTILNQAMRIVDHGSTSANISGDPHVPGFMVRTDNTDKIIVEIANKVSPNDLFMQLVTTSGLTVGEWTQIYVVVDRAVGIECFFNGVSAGTLSKDSSGINIGNGRGFNLGYNAEKNTEFFQGILDEVKIFATKVTQEQIVQEIDNCDENCETCAGAATTCQSCIEGRYLDSDACHECSANCKTCEDNADKCLSCEDYQYLTGTDTCDYCDSNCKTCSTTSDNCESCNDKLFLNGSNECIECNPDCKTCETSKETCTSCYPPNILTTSNTCEECSENCYKCEDLPSKCTSCKGSMILLSDFTCKEPTCDQKCDGCQEDDDSKCIVCQAAEGRGQTPPNCECEKGYYEEGNKNCSKCPGECEECNNNGKCTICKLSNMDLEQNCKKSVITEGVTPSFSVYIPETGEYTEEECNPICKSCETTADNCSLCQEGLNRQTNAPICSCQDGFYDNGTDQSCQACPKGCLICSSPKGICLSYSTECEDKQFYDQDKKQCMDCFYFQDVCIKNCPVNTVINGQNCDQPETKDSLIMLVTYIIGGLVFIGFIYFIVVQYKTKKIMQISNKFANEKSSQQQYNNVDQPELESQVQL